MKIKNKCNDVRKLFDAGKIVIFGPGEIIDCNKPVFNKNTFEQIKEQKKTTKREDKSERSRI